ncbi:MAG: carboxynorspermidine decarboxylase [Myxococcaceae bacterium]|nr:carboxynorspermidine decarboxylase [Myxococcaceae bacterium]
MTSSPERPLTGMLAIDPDKAPDSPCWVIDMPALEDNLRLLARIQREADCKILLALKGFSTFSTFPLVAKYLAGATSSSPHEAQLAREELGGEVHCYAPAFTEADLREVLRFSDHIVFNSFSQWQRLGPIARAAGASCGIRVNPEQREVEVELYDPCAPRSRLGVIESEFRPDLLEGLEGLHFHALCELGADALERVLAAFERRFGKYLKGLKWVNFGGGHHITKPGYDTDLLVRLVRDFKARYGVEVYLEPGEAIAIRTGVLVATVLDIVHNQMPLAILDTSATAHMPDTLEMPYRPDIVGAGQPGEKAHTYRLGGLTCLAGDVIGDYSFGHELSVGERIVLLDMSHYTLVKTSTFNGVRLPSIALRHADDRYELIKRFGYASYRDRLG